MKIDSSNILNYVTFIIIISYFDTITAREVCMSVCVCLAVL